LETFRCLDARSYLELQWPKGSGHSSHRLGRRRWQERANVHKNY
jgi:hypothetical protein